MKINLEEIGIKNTKNYAEVLDEMAIDQMREVMNHSANVQGALMADSHGGYVLPIGGVVKSLNTIFPSYVGFDIGCGVSAIKLNIKKEDIDLKKLKRNILENIAIGNKKNKNKKTLKENEVYFNTIKNKLKFKDFDEKNIISQLSSLGGGNHFIEVGYGKDDFIWIVIHSGSRGFGYKIAEHYIKEAAIENNDEERYIKEFELNNYELKKKDLNLYKTEQKEFVYRRIRAKLNTKIEGNFGLDLNSKRGKDYLNDMNIALEFALENRKKMIYKIVNFLDNPKDLYFINRNHNHAEVIVENNKKFVIHRKGATHAEKDMDGVIPGNMRDGSFIVKGKGNKNSLKSSSHGAGRVLSRMKAKELLNIEELNKEMEGIETNHKSSTIDESPKAYKNIFEVMELQKDLIDIIDYIKPILNIKG